MAAGVEGEWQKQVVRSSAEYSVNHMKPEQGRESLTDKIQAWIVDTMGKVEGWRIASEIKRGNWVWVNEELDRVDPRNKPVTNLSNRIETRYLRQGSGMDGIPLAYFRDLPVGGQVFELTEEVGGKKMVKFGGNWSFSENAVVRILNGDGRFKASLIPGEKVQIPLVDMVNGEVNVITISLDEFKRLSKQLLGDEKKEDNLNIGEAAGASDKGVVRGTDEDSYLVAVKGERSSYQLANAHLQIQLRTGMERVAESNHKLLNELVEKLLDSKTGVDGVFIVADGMGGHGKGEQASQRVLIKIVQEINNSGGFVNLLPDQVKTKIDKAVREVNNDIVKGNLDSGSDSGSTLTMAIVINGDLYTVNMGDSRVYMINEKGDLQRLTKDHSLVERLIAAGQVKEEERRTFNQRNVIFSFMGKDQAQIEVSGPIKVLGKSKLLVCCDGVWEEIEDKRLREILLTGGNPNQICETIIKEANANGGNDNITAIVAEVGK